MKKYIYGRPIVTKVELDVEACYKVSFGYKPVYDKRGLFYDMTSF